MNRFVILLQEEYDQYGPTVPHPVETQLDKQGLWQCMRHAFEKWKRDFEAAEQRRREGDEYAHSPSADFVLADTGTTMNCSDVGSWYWADPKNRVVAWDFRPPDILTVDEWFALYANKRFNRP